MFNEAKSCWSIVLIFLLKILIRSSRKINYLEVGIMGNIKCEYICEKQNIQVTAVFSKDKKHRFLLKKEWDSSKENITFLMLNPSKADVLRSDNTVNNATNYAIDKGFGSITIDNLFADRGTNSDCLVRRDTSTDVINDKYIEQALKESKEFVIAWERSVQKRRKRKVAETLKKEPEKLKCFVEYKEDEKSFEKIPVKVNHLRIFKETWKYESWNPVKDLEIELSNK
jgi:hypothetical protein